MSVEFYIRLVGALVSTVVGLIVALNLSRIGQTEDVRAVLVLMLVGFGLGLLITPYFTTRPLRWLRAKIRQVPASYFLYGTIGLIVGLIIAALLSLPLSLLPPPLGNFLPVVVALLFGYVGVAVMIMRERDLATTVRSRFLGERGKRYVLLDTSVIIDGRIADITRTGFIDATLLVPRFVLNELQHIADSPDPLRRKRGRRGLEMLNKMMQESSVPIEITDEDIPDLTEVDSKLVALAQRLGAAIITNDYNLNRVAAVQGVRVLNINELANALRPVVIPGETITVTLIQEGKEPGQGVGYLDDGTMVVVENGREFIGQTVDVVVTRMLQTVAGRMIFAQVPEPNTQPAR
nr:PIN domain-containing protein [Ardenticatena sp.]